MTPVTTRPHVANANTNTNTSNTRRKARARLRKLAYDGVMAGYVRDLSLSDPARQSHR